MGTWQSQLQYDPISILLQSNNQALLYYVNRDLLEKKVPSIESIWNLPEPQKIIRKQQSDGSWKSKSANQGKAPAVNYNLTETWKQIRFLIEKYEINRSHSSIAKGCEYIFSCQTGEGDIRGILGNQYAAYYTGAIMSLLIKAGYEDDPRIEKGFQWLLSVRQTDGGWLANSLMALDISWEETRRLTSQNVKPIPFQNFTKPSSHNWTGMVIRAFATHPNYRHTTEAKTAASLLKAKFFQKDPHYTSLQDAAYWIRFQFPFWWNNLVAALDSLSLMGFTQEDPDINNAILWLIDNQQEDGLWRLSYSPKHKIKENSKTIESKLWVSFVICRILKRLYNQREK